MTKPAAVRSYGGVSAEDRRAERRTRLLAAAKRTWGESGVGAVTVRGICKATGLTDRYFYEHFANREELLLAVADNVRNELLTALVRAGASTKGTPQARIRSALQAFLDAVADDPHIYRIVSSNPTGIPALAQRRHAIRFVADLVVQTTPDVLARDFAPDRLHRAALFIAGGVNQLVEDWLAGTITLTTEELATECARMCIDIINHAQA